MTLTRLWIRAQTAPSKPKFTISAITLLFSVGLLSKLAETKARIHVRVGCTSFPSNPPLNKKTVAKKPKNLSVTRALQLWRQD